MVLLERRLQVGEAAEDAGGAGQRQQAEAAGGGRVGPHAVHQLHYQAEEYCRQHLQEIYHSIFSDHN